MAVILKTPFLQNGTMGPVDPMLYVDSINKDSYIAEMYNLCINYIRENTKSPSITEFKRDHYMAINENEIYYNKTDGFWIVGNEKDKVVTLYMRKTLTGIFYNSTLVEK